MSQDNQEHPGEAAPASETTTTTPGWRLGRLTKVLLAASVALMLTGLVVGALGDGAAPDAERRVATAKPLQPGASAKQVTDEQEPISKWAGPLFRLGFSFVVGFCVAYALRAVFKLAVIFIGLIVLALFGLQYAGAVTIDWGAIGGHYDSVADWLAAQAGSFQRFVTGYLPSAGTAAVGLVAGFRRH